MKWFVFIPFSPQCNGMSNRFWGWGREDDEFYRRLRKAELQVKVSRKQGTKKSVCFYFKISDKSYFHQ